MRRLDHFERTGLAPKDYSTWCEHALSGAYDWIDHERLGVASTTPSSSGSAARPSGGATPEWLSRGGQKPAQPEDSPTAPVPSVAPRWSDSGFYGNGNGDRNPNRGGGAQQGGDDDGKGRNIFRIFTN